MPHDVSDTHALTFDVFGTVVDWRGSIVREGEELSRRKGLRVDWAAFADAWRDGYKPAMQRVRGGELPWTNFDPLHRIILDGLLDEFGLRGLDEAELDDLNRVWHRLDPWPDAPAGLERLRKKFVVATLSNGNVAQLVNLSKHAGLSWDCVLSAELARHYKPDREVYEMAARLLDLPPARVLMVAAHVDDLRAARDVGFRTAWVSRPLEHGPGHSPERADPAEFDIVAHDFNDLAARLGA